MSRTRAFTRLARTHAAAAAGDASVAVALAGSLFFSIDYDAARWRIVLYLVLTLAPFAVVAPLLGPAIDRARSGARWLIVGSVATRAAVALLLVGHLDSLLLFPEAFTMLVMGKSYQVAKSTYLPTVVDSDTALVATNARMALLSAVSAGVGAVPAVICSRLFGPQAAMAVAMCWFAVAAWCSFMIPAPPATVVGRPTVEERAELASGGIRVVASAMGGLRSAVGFLTFWIAFELRAADASPVEFALVLGPIAAGAITGSLVAPRVRRILREEQMLAGALIVVGVAAALAAFMGGLRGAGLLGAGVAVVSASAKLAFDALVQRDAPHADKGRAFATYEARFQLLWVIGALVGVLVPLPLRAGFVLVAVGAALAGLRVVHGQRAVAAGKSPPTLPDLVHRVLHDPTPLVGRGRGGAA